MFDVIYYEFIRKVNEVNIQNNEDLILINEKKLRTEMQRFFLIMLKSKNCLIKATKILGVTQKRFEEEIGKLTTKVKMLKKKLKRRKTSRNSPYHRRRTMAYGPYSHRVVHKLDETKSKSQSRKPNLTKNIPKRAKTPNLTETLRGRTAKRDKSKGKRTVSTNKKVQTQKYITAKVSAEKQLDNDNKSKKKKIPKTASPVKKAEPTLKGKVSENILSNKVLVPSKINDSKTQNNKTENENSKMKPYSKQANESKTSLFNNRISRTSFYDVTKISLNNVLLSQDLTQLRKDPVEEFTSAINSFRDKLAVDSLFKHGSGKLKVGISKKIVMKRLVKKLEKRLKRPPKRRTKLGNKTTDDDSDSDVSALNPLEL